MTIHDVLNQATRLLEEHRISLPRLTAEVLLFHQLKTDRAYLIAHDADAVSPEAVDAYERSIRSRISGTPLQYITGVQEFFGRSFNVTPAVLIPRPETEHLVEFVLQHRPTPRPRVIDIGTGSGCIAITLALEIPGARVFASDISIEALQVARENTKRLGAAVHFVASDLLSALAGPFDIIASNPPYVSRSELNSVQREVREHEPQLAVFAPGNPLDLFRSIELQARQMLSPGGLLVMEIGFGMAESVMELFGKEWVKYPAVTDLQGIPRTIAASRL